MDTSRRAFPKDLYENIMLKLPVNSLLRFKCMCKNWYALIKNPSFIKQHLNNGRKKESRQLLIYDSDGSPPVTLICDDKRHDDNLNYLESFTNMSTTLVGSVDGLFLVYRADQDKVYRVNQDDDDKIWLLTLWNPATREVRVLPEIPLSIYTDVFGFGLDPSTNDYKVVYFDKQYAAVYSFSEDSWKIFTHNFFRIQEVFNTPFVSFDNFHCRSAYLNGAYYWAIRERDHRCNFLSFDLSNEVFGDIEGPPNDDNSFMMPILFDDSLALLDLHLHPHYVLWVMIQPGIWNKLFTFECFPFHKSWYSTTVIVATRSCRLVSYNVKTHQTMRLGFHHPRLSRNLQVYTYKESLIIIKRQN